MTRCYHVPCDLCSRPQFRHLANDAGGENAAAAIIFLLFRDLAYLADHHPLGFLPKAQLPLLDNLFPPDKTNVTDLLIRHGLLLPLDLEGVEGFTCPLFAGENDHLVPGRISMQKQGGLVRGVKSKREALEVDAQRQALMIAPEWFTKEDGARMDPAEINRVTSLVLLLDNYMGRKQRLNREYTEGLIADAWRALAARSEAEINRLCVWIHQQRQSNAGHSALPATTEQLLSQFEMFVELALKS